MFSGYGLEYTCRPGRYLTEAVTSLETVCVNESDGAYVLLISAKVLQKSAISETPNLEFRFPIPKIC
jgi:hypothetical protein